MTNRIILDDAELPIDAAVRRLHAAGWSVRDVAAASHWLVSGANGENLIHAVGDWQSAAWQMAIEQATSVGMLGA
jgi:hypothetical protein